jgi:phosphomannomutase
VSDLDKIFKAYDIRGVVPDELGEDVAEAVGAAFVRLTGTAQLVIVHDMRTSSEPLAAAIARGAAGQGANVINGGLGSTDMAYYARGPRHGPRQHGSSLGEKCKSMTG